MASGECFDVDTGETALAKRCKRYRFQFHAELGDNFSNSIPRRRKKLDSFLGSNAIRVSKQILFLRMAIISVNYLAASFQKSTLKEARASLFSCFKQKVLGMGVFNKRNSTIIAACSYYLIKRQAARKYYQL